MPATVLWVSEEPEQGDLTGLTSHSQGAYVQKTPAAVSETIPAPSPCRVLGAQGLYLPLQLTDLKDVVLP